MIIPPVQMFADAEEYLERVPPRSARWDFREPPGGRASAWRGASLPCALRARVASRVRLSYLGIEQEFPVTVQSPAAALAPNAKFIAVCCGVGAAACWAVGLVAARHGIAAGLAPVDLAFHRFMWSGLIMLPLAWRWGLGD